MSSLGIYCCKTPRRALRAQHWNQVLRTANQNCVGWLFRESILRAARPKILLQQYRHFSEVARVAFAGRSRLQSGRRSTDGDGTYARRDQTLRLIATSQERDPLFLARA